MGLSGSLGRAVKRHVWLLLALSWSCVAILPVLSHDFGSNPLYTPGVYLNGAMKYQETFYLTAAEDLETVTGGATNYTFHENTTLVGARHLARFNRVPISLVQPNPAAFGSVLHVAQGEGQKEEHFLGTDRCC